MAETVLAMRQADDEHWAARRPGQVCIWRTESSLETTRGLKRSHADRRRALTAEEIGRLLNARRAECRLLYQVALSTGLRVNELRSLTVGDFNADLRALRLDEHWTKGRKGGLQPLPIRLAEALERETAGKASGEPLLCVPTQPARTLAGDLKRAGIPKWTPEGKVDFHSLRNTYASLLDQAGASPKENQTLMRHSMAALTMETYARARQDRLSAMAEAVGGKVSSSAECVTCVSRKAAGAQGLVMNGACARGSRQEKMEPAEGFEPSTPALRKLCSSVELRRPAPL